MPPARDDDDFGLVERYARGRDEAAFAEIVRRHLSLVYTAAVRRVGHRQLAEDVTQAVFVILATKANAVRRSAASAPLSAWLLTTVRYAAANALRIEARRRRHEQAAAAAAAARNGGSGACSANPSDVLVWHEVAAQLDDAVLRLPAADRRAVLMRFFENRPIADIAAALHVSEGAAKQRLSRSVEKLRHRLERAAGAGAGVTPIAAGGWVSMLESHAVRAAPAGLLGSTLAAVAGGTAAAGGAAGAGITIAKGAITMMSWTKAKIAAAVVVASMIGTGAIVTVSWTGAQEQKRPATPTTPATPPAAQALDEPATKADKADKADKAENRVSVAKAPPVVVKTVPQAGALTVDPATTEIRVTYSKEMKDGSWSWSTWGEENFPKTTGKPKYMSDKRTCVLPVKLEPGRAYAIWLNSNNFGNFQDSESRQAVPYLLVFETRK